MIVITQFGVNTAKNCQGLIRFMNVSYEINGRAGFFQLFHHFYKN
jgi:hypothetical protein